MIASIISCLLQKQKNNLILEYISQQVNIQHIPYYPFLHFNTCNIFFGLPVLTNVNIKKPDPKKQQNLASEEGDEKLFIAFNISSLMFNRINDKYFFNEKRKILRKTTLFLWGINL